MIKTWVVVLMLEFAIILTYFLITGPVHELFYILESYGAPGEFIGFVSFAYNMAFLVGVLGLIAYALLRSVKTEHDTFKY